MTEVFHYTSQLQAPTLPPTFPPSSLPMIRQWWTEKRAHGCSPCPSDCGGCLLSVLTDCPLPQPQRHTLGLSTRGPPHFTKRDDNPFARKIHDLPVASGPTEDSGWCIKSVCVCVCEVYGYVLQPDQYNV